MTSQDDGRVEIGDRTNEKCLIMHDGDLYGSHITLVPIVVKEISTLNVGGCDLFGKKCNIVVIKDMECTKGHL
jgi:hypothetical protein